jgi:GNAT superfamily N-acetyltransferase
LEEEKRMSNTGEIEVVEATADRWADFETVMGPRGGSGGCWCMLWRVSRKTFDAEKGDGLKAAMRGVFQDVRPPGLIAYADGTPAGWCSIAPRADFPRLETSRILKPVDENSVWSVTCLTVVKAHRRKGVSVALLNAAAEFVARRGGAIVEGYPVEPDRPNYPPVYAWTGVARAYLSAGYHEVARRSPTRPIMRRLLEEIT